MVVTIETLKKEAACLIQAHGDEDPIRIPKPKGYEIWQEYVNSLKLLFGVHENTPSPITSAGAQRH